MTTIVQARPSHYDILRVAPGASGEEIARAFAREAGALRPRPIAELARITLAYETLRDPAKRRAYDESLRPKPAPRPSSSMMPRAGWPIVRSAAASPSPRQNGHSAAPPKPMPETAKAPEPDLRLPPFLAASLRNDARLEENADADPVAPHATPQPGRRPIASPPAAPVQAAFVEAGLPDAEEEPVDWKRPAIAGGALFAGVALVGAWIGWDSGGPPPDRLDPGAQAVTLTVPEAKPAANSRTAPAEVAQMPAPMPATRSSSARLEREAAPAVSKEVAGASAVAPDAEGGVAAAAESDADTGPGRIEQIESALAAGDSASPPPAVAAKLPLANSTIARTIGRIGYACGSVASATPVEGAAAGVFKVTCTSGDVYRAAPVRGRYHFRRWGKQ